MISRREPDDMPITVPPSEAELDATDRLLDQIAAGSSEPPWV